MTAPTIFIVDDDFGVRDSLSLLLSQHGYRTQLFGNARDILDVISADAAGCALIDIRMQDMGGLELQMTLRKRGIRLPVIMMSGFANLATARTAFQAGAIDFLSKPLSEPELLGAIRHALALGHPGTQVLRGCESGGIAVFGVLSRREIEVAKLLAVGRSSREVGEQLAISGRTVETYKRRVMKKLGLHRLADLIRVASIALASDEAS